jgi:hypothetical protein
MKPRVGREGGEQGTEMMYQSERREILNAAAI